MADPFETLAKYGLLSPNRNTYLLVGLACLWSSSWVKPVASHWFSSLRLESHVFSILVITGLCLILLYGIFTLNYFMDFWARRSELRRQYSIKDLDKRFHLINAGNVGYLLDATDPENKLIRWIENWTTAQDLEFIGCWTVFHKTLAELRDDEEIKKRNGIVRLNSGEEFKLEDYKVFGYGIRTREAAGSGPKS